MREFDDSETENPPKWEEIKGAEYHCFQWGNDPELIHIIKTGFADRYMIVWEDAYELSLGNVEFLSKNEIEQRFKITF